MARRGKNKKQEYIRKEIYSIDFIFEQIKTTKVARVSRGRERPYITLDGDEVWSDSQRYQNFMEHGTICVDCGLEGVYFAKEKDYKSKETEPYHLNLYAIDAQGKEVLMTKDHIVPKSRGGENIVENYQPMCCRCNRKKGNQLEEERKEI